MQFIIYFSSFEISGYSEKSEIIKRILAFAKPGCDNVLQPVPRSGEGYNALIHKGLATRLYTEKNVKSSLLLCLRYNNRKMFCYLRLRACRAVSHCSPGMTSLSCCIGIAAPHHDIETITEQCFSVSG